MLFINDNASSSLIPVVNASQAFNLHQNQHWDHHHTSSPNKQYSVSSSDDNNNEEEDDQEEEELKEANLDYDSIEEEPNNGGHGAIKEGDDSDHDATYEAYNDTMLAQQ